MPDYRVPFVRQSTEKGYIAVEASSPADAAKIAQEMLDESDECITYAKYGQCETILQDAVLAPEDK